MLATVTTMGLPMLFASRVFLPAFAAAFTLRFGSQMGFDTGALAAMAPDAPSWFLSDACIGLLGFLSLCELIANRSQGAREILAMTDQYGKPALAGLTGLGLLSAADADFAARALQQQAGVASIAMVAGIAAATFYLASWRATVLEQLHDADGDDDSGVLGFLSWGEDFFSVFGIVLLILAPFLALGALALVGAGLYALRRRAELREEASKAPCGSCGAPRYRAAVKCPACAAPNPAPARLNFLGVASDAPVPDPSRQPLLLAMSKRCPACAARLTERSPHQSCACCGDLLFHTPGFRDAYDRALLKRLPGVLAVCSLLGLVPVLGLLAGVLYYKFSLIAPYRRYLPRGYAFGVRWGLRLLFVGLFFVQWVPLVGAAAVPLMAAANFVAFRGVFLRLSAEPAGAGALAPCPESA